MARTKYGYRHAFCGIDLGGEPIEAVWIEEAPQIDAPEQDPGWWAQCEVEPDAGWIGPFTTENEARRTATEENVFQKWAYDYCC